MTKNPQIFLMRAVFNRIYLKWAWNRQGLGLSWPLPLHKVLPGMETNCRRQSCWAVQMPLSPVIFEGKGPVSILQVTESKNHFPLHHLPHSHRHRAKYSSVKGKERVSGHNSEHDEDNKHSSHIANITSCSEATEAHQNQLSTLLKPALTIKEHTRYKKGAYM